MWSNRLSLWWFRILGKLLRLSSPRQFTNENFVISSVFFLTSNTTWLSLKRIFLHCLFSSYIQFINASKLKKDSSLYIGMTFSIVVSHYRTISASEASQILRLFLLLDFTSSFVYSARILGKSSHFTFLLSPTHTNYCIPNRLLGLLRCLNHYMWIAI